MTDSMTAVGPDPTSASAPVKKRGAIIGTASTWKLAPFADLSLDILGLNDGYTLGVPRATHWFDLHPFQEMVFRPRGQRVVNRLEVPAGAYVRPEGHLEWLKSRPHPVWLQQARPDFPTSRTFPREALQAKYGPYFSSTPAWMLAWMLEEGYQEIHVYGIHLATQWEYVQQRPNLEFLLGIALQRGVAIVIPNKSPLMKNSWVYAYDPKPDIPLDRLQRKIEEIKQRGKVKQDRLAAIPRYTRWQAEDLRAQLAVVNLELQDAQMEFQQMNLLMAHARVS